MKSRKCRMTQHQRDIHTQAVKLRNMTDEKLVEYIESVRSAAEEEGFVRGQGEQKDGGMAEFLQDLDKIKGIGIVTIAKLRRYAVDAGYVSGEEVTI